MSDISEMNDRVRKRAAYWAVAMAALGLLAIAPDSVVRLLHGDPTKQLWWSALVGGALAMMFLVEGFEIGRHSRHRSAINLLISQGVVRQVCTNLRCPQKDDPNESVRNTAMALFYKAIDAPSRQVAFHNWGWYYFSVLAMWMSLVALAIALVGLRLPTQRGDLRALGYICLGGAAFMMWRLRLHWERKNELLVNSQLSQISGSLGSKLPTASCEELACPAT